MNKPPHITELTAMTRLQELGMRFLKERNLEPVLTEIVDAAIAFSQADFGTVQILDLKTSQLKIVAQRGFEKWWLDYWNTVCKGQGTCGTALPRHERIIVEDIEASPIFIGTPSLEIQRRAGVNAVQSTPLFGWDGEIIGVFSTHYRRPHRPDAASLHLLDLLSYQAASIIERARAEDAMRESNEALRGILETMGEGLYTLDANGLITYMNPMAEKLLGWSAKEILGQKMHDVNHYKYPDGRPYPANECAALVVLMEGRPLINQEDFIIRRDGSFFPVMYSSSPRVKDGSVTGLTVAFRDMTNAKRTEESLKRSSRDLARLRETAAQLRQSNDELGRARERLVESEKRYRLLVESVTDYAIYMVSREGKVSSWTEGAQKIYGYSAEQALGISISAFLCHEEASEDVVEQELRDVQRNGHAEAEAWRIRKDGSRFWAHILTTPVRDSDGTLRGYSKVVRDLTEKKRAEDALRLQSEIAEKMEEGLVLMRLSDFTIIYNNRRFEKILGYEPGELVGKPIWIINPKTDTSPEDKARRIAAQFNEKGTWSGEVLNVRKDGKPSWAHVTLSTMEHSEFGRILISVHSDITEDKKMRDQLASQANELARSNAELERFAFLAAHDLKEPMRMVATFCRLLSQKTRGSLTPECRDYLSFAVDGASRAQAMVQNLLEYSRVHTSRQSVVAVKSDEVAREAILNLKPLIEETGAKVTIGGLPALNADRHQMLRLLQNLLENAIKYRRPDALPEIWIDAKQSDGQWEFSVRDNGIGIPEKDRCRIFELFQRLHSKNLYSGTGIGLATCKRIVDRHGGRIWVESPPQGGSLFRFTIPVRQPGIERDVLPAEASAVG